MTMTTVLRTLQSRFKEEHQAEMHKCLRDLGRIIAAVMVGGQLAQEVARGEEGETTSNVDLAAYIIGIYKIYA